MTLKDQLEQEIGRRQFYLAHTTDDLSQLRSRLNTSLTSASPPHKPDVESVIVDHQANMVDDLVEPLLIGRAISPIRAAFTRSSSPFTGHRALPHSPVPLRCTLRK